MKSLPEIMADLYGCSVAETQDDLGDVHAELRTIRAMLDELARIWGDEGQFCRARDRLRKVIGE